MWRITLTGFIAFVTKLPDPMRLILSPDILVGELLSFLANLHFVSFFLFLFSPFFRFYFCYICNAHASFLVAQLKWWWWRQRERPVYAVELIFCSSSYKFDCIDTAAAYTLILPMSQLQTHQLMTSQIRSHTEYLIQTYNTLMLILCAKLKRTVAALTVFNTI